MPSFSLDSLPKEQRIQLIAEFYDAVASLKSREQVKNFFRNLLHPSEIAMLMRRIEIAALLIAGYPHRRIRDLTGVGKGTITRVHKKVAREERGEGFHAVVKHVIEQRKKRIQRGARAPIEAYSYADIKRRYPAYYLLDTILEEVANHFERKSKDFTTRAIKKTPSRKH